MMPLSHRRLPHLYVIGAPLFVTFRLHNSLPPNREFPSRLPSGKAFVCMDRLLDEERLSDDQFHSDFHFGPSLPAVVFVPATRVSMDPFAGSPNGGDYYYWLTREYSQGRVSKAEFNRRMYGIGRK